jgi:Skp family chaperone for outer membrane proteins
MIASSLLSAAAALVMAAALAVPTSQASQPALTGPVIAGVCVVSPDAVLGASKVGHAVTVRLQQLAQTAQQDLQAERASIEAEAQAIQAAKGLSQAQTDQRRTALAARVKALQDKVATRNRELEYTRTKQFTRISEQAQPLIVAAYTGHGCGLLFRRESLLGGNPANDLTAEVVHGLDGKLTALSFDREAPPQTVAPTASAGS